MIFSEELKLPGVLKGFKCTVDTKMGQTPIHRKDFRKSELEHTKVKEFNDEKLKNKIAEPEFES